MHTVIIAHIQLPPHHHWLAPYLYWLQKTDHTITPKQFHIYIILQTSKVVFPNLAATTQLIPATFPATTTNITQYNSKYLPSTSQASLSNYTVASTSTSFHYFNPSGHHLTNTSFSVHFYISAQLKLPLCTTLLSNNPFISNTTPLPLSNIDQHQPINPSVHCCMLLPCPPWTTSNINLLLCLLLHYCNNSFNNKPLPHHLLDHYLIHINS